MNLLYLQGLVVCPIMCVSRFWDIRALFSLIVLLIGVHGFNRCGSADTTQNITPKGTSIATLGSLWSSDFLWCVVRLF